MKTQDIQKLISAAVAALTPIVDSMEEPNSFFSREEKTKLSLAYLTLLQLQRDIRKQINRAPEPMPWEDDPWNS